MSSGGRDSREEGPLRRRARDLAERLFGASPALTDVGDRERARLLATLLATVVPLGLVAGVIQELTIADFHPTLLAMLGALAMLTVAYGASRTRHYRLGGLIASLAPVVATAVVGLVRPSDRAWWAFMEIGVLLATVFLPTLWAAGVAAATFGLLVAVLTLGPALEPEARWPPIVFHGILSPLLVIAAAHRRRIESQRAQAVRALEMARRMETIGRLAGGIAHDFNNVLTVVAGGAEILSDLAPEHRELIATIQDATTRAAQLVHQLLAYARKQVLEPKEVDVDAIVRDAQRLLTRLAGESELTVALDARGHRVRADPAQLEQVLTNLVVNARDATSAGGRIFLSTEVVALEKPRAGIASGAYVALSVRDDGVGMPPEVLDRVFEPFFSTKDPAANGGLGLSTVYGIVVQSGGGIVAESAVGKGSRFVIYLPDLSAGSPGVA